MLRVGLTGGIGSGKSTVAQRFRELGAVVIDADQLAREVVAVESEGLAAIRQRFGEAVMSPDGSLDRGALGGIVFTDDQARKDLEAITHPLIGARARSLMESAAPEKIVVHEVPLLAELDMAADYHLTVVVAASEDIRLARLTGGRGFTQADARARVAAQVGDGVRRASADVWLDNSGTVGGLLAQTDALWHERIVGFNENLIGGSPSHGPYSPALVAYDDSWPATAERLSRRVALVLGRRALAVEHIGSTSVPGLLARDVIDLQIGVRALADADEADFIHALADKGFPRSENWDHTAGHLLGGIDEVSRRIERFHANADPGQMVAVKVREIDGPAWRRALLLRDWLCAQPDERNAYGELKRQLARSEATTTSYTQAKGPWLQAAFARADAWALTRDGATRQ
jgi:dephospho-CoA kinase